MKMRMPSSKRRRGKQKKEVGEIAQQLRASTALPGDLTLVPAATLPITSALERPGASPKALAPACTYPATSTLKIKFFKIIVNVSVQKGVWITA